MNDDARGRYEAYKLAEQLLGSGTPEQSVLFTLTGRGFDLKTAQSIIDDIRSGKNRLRNSARSREQIAVARHMAIELLVIGLINIAIASALIGLITAFFAKDILLFVLIGLLAMWRGSIGLSNVFNGSLNYIMGWEPLKNPSPPKRPWPRRWL
jgi:hypothetical protein